MTERLLRIRDVEHSVGLKKSAIYQMIKDGEFPAPVKIGAASLWSERSVQAWIAKKLENEGGIGMSDQKMAEVETTAMTKQPEAREPDQPLALSSSAVLGPTRFAPTVTMPGGGVVTPDGWMWVLGFAMAGCEWAIEAAERDGVQQMAMDYRRRQRIYWQERDVAEAEERLAAKAHWVLKKLGGA